ncbi:MAG: hypothetical protein AAF828_00505 [Bacteroidota bacterium]
MMSARTLAAFLLTILCFNSFLAQIYSEGEFRLELKSLILPQFPDTTSMEYQFAKSMIARDITMTIIYKPDTIAVKKDDGSRAVVDINGGLIYEFKEILDRKYFFLDTLSVDINGMNEFVNMAKSSTRGRISEPVFLKNYKFGLDCWQYVISEGEGNLTVLTSAQIDMPYQKNGALDTLIKGTVIEILMEDTLGSKVEIGITSFNPEIKDAKIFSIDTSGYENGTELRRGLQENIAKYNEEKRIEQQEFGEYENRSINQDLLQKLVTDGVLDLEAYDVSYALEQGESLDIPSILLLNKLSKKGFQFMSSAALLDVFEESEVLSPTLEFLLKEKSALWDSLPTDKKFSAICLAAIKDHLNKAIIKQQVIENLHTMKYGDFADISLINSFVTGDLSYEELFNKVDNLQKLYQGYVYDDDELVQRIEDLFQLALKGHNLSYSSSRQDSILTIEVTKELYTFNINKLKDIDYEQRVDGKYLPKDSTLINMSFYQTLLNTQKQIAADNKIDYSFSIFALDPPFTYEVREYEYNELVSIIPELAIKINTVFLNSFMKDEHDSFRRLGSSFPFHPDGREVQISFPFMQTGDLREYITTSQKKAFLKLAKNNDLGLTITEKNLNNLEERIFLSLYDDPYELIRAFDNYSFTPKQKKALEGIFKVSIY